MNSQHLEQPAASPPQPPEFRRGFSLFRWQYVAIPLLALLPVLALFGLFDPNTSVVRAPGDTFELVVRYVDRLRYNQGGLVEVIVRNTSSEPHSVTVRLDRALLDQFSNVTLTPSADEVSEDAYYVTLADVPPGEAREVLIEGEAEQYWRHAGAIQASAEGGEPVTVSLTTFIFP